MKMDIKSRLFFLLFILLGTLPINDVNAQERLSVNQLKDLTDNASKMLNTLTDYISIIAAAEESYDTRQKGIELCIKLFTQNALIEEQNKATKTKKSYPPGTYLNLLKIRSEKAPIIIDFQITDPLDYSDFEKIDLPDNTVVYRANIKIKQYYCVLKPVNERVEVGANNRSLNCQYNDVTEKMITVEIKKQKSSKADLWIVLLTGINVVRVGNL